MRRITWIIVSLVLVVSLGLVGCEKGNSPTAPVVPQIDGESEGFPSSLSLLHEASIGKNTFKVYAEKTIDAAALLEGVEANDSAETILSKVDAKRTALYPDEQILVNVNLANQTGRVDLAN